MSNPLDLQSVLARLRDQYPGSYDLNKIKLSQHRVGYEWSMGKSTYVPRMFRYKFEKYKKLLNINQFLAAKLTDIAAGPNAELGIKQFAGNYMDYIKEPGDYGVEHTLMYKMPRSRALGRASYYKRAGMVQDIDALEAEMPLQDWAAKRASEGFAADPDQFTKYMYQTKNVSDLMPGFGGLQDIRKWSTLENFNVVGRAASATGAATFGAEAPLSLTRGMIETAHRQAQAYLYESGGHVMDKAARLTELTNQFLNTGQAHMVQYSAAERLAGGPFLYKQDLFKGQYTFPQKEVFLTPADQMALKRALKADIEDIPTSAGLKGNITKIELIQSGMDPRRASRVLQAMEAQKRGDVFSLSREKTGVHPVRSLRIIYGQRQAIGGASKFSLGHAKGLGAEVRATDYRGVPIKGGYMDMVRAAAPEGAVASLRAAAREEAGGDSALANKLFRRANKPASIMASHVSDQARNLARDFEAAQIWLTHPGYMANEEQAIANAKKLAGVLGPGVEATGRQLKFRENLPFTEEHAARAVNMLSPTQRAMWMADKMPQWVNVISERSRVKFGRLAGITINDIAGLKIQGMHRIGQLYSQTIASNPYANQIKDVFGYLTGRTPNINALQVGAGDVDELLGRAGRGRGGTLANYEGSMLFDPARDVKGPMLYDLGKDITVNIGGAEKTINKLPLMSQEARGLVQASGGNVYATPMEKPYLEFLEAARSGADLTPHAQEVVDAMGRLGGKKGLVDRRVARTKVQGIYGTGAFLSPEAEGVLQAAYGERGGFVGLTNKMAQKIFPDMSMEEIGSRMDEGLYLPFKRYPEAPRGTGIGRAFLMDKFFKDTANFGEDAIYSSPGLGAFVHEDLDEDKVTILTEWADAARKNPEIHKTMEEAYKRQLPRYEGFEREVLDKMKKRDLPKPHPAWSEVFQAAEFKAKTTGAAYVTGMQTYEGALTLAGKGGLTRNTPEYASDMAQVMFGIAESGINVKRREGNQTYNTDLFDILKREDVAGLEGMSADVIQQLHGDKYVGAGRRKFVRDIMQSARYGAESATYGRRMEPYNQYRSLYKAKSVQDIDRAINITAPAEGTIMQDMAGSGALRVAKSIGASNRILKNAAGKKSIGGMAQEAFGNFTKGLREGRGWTSIAAGAVILAGVGLGMKKPGNIIVQAQEPVNESSAPVVQPRRQSTSRVVTQGQFDVRIKIRDARKVDRSKFVDLGQVISGKYKSPSKVQVNINDDTSDVDYKRIFDDAYRRAMTQGRG